MIQLKKILKKISDSIDSDFSKAETLYAELKETLDKLAEDDKTYTNLISNQPTRYKEVSTEEKDENGNNITKSVETDEYKSWLRNKSDLETAFDNYVIAIERKKRDLAAINDQSIDSSLENASISTDAPVFEMPEGVSKSLDNSAIFTSDGSVQGNAFDIWKYFTSKVDENGNRIMTDAAVAGILGNVQAECDFDPNQLEKINASDAKKGYGIIQWTNYKGDTVNGRRAKLERAAQERGVDKSSLAFQCDYLWEESVDPNSGYGKELKRRGFYSTNDPQKAAKIFHDVIEKSADSQERIQSRRCNTASNWYNEFSGVYA